MANPTGKGGFTGKDDPRRNNGGRTPSKWLHAFLDAANDTSASGDTRREAIAHHLLSVATSWEVRTKGTGENAIQVADAKAAIEAAKLLMGYDMGKPVDIVELSSPDGTMSPAGSLETSGERRSRLLSILGKGPAAFSAPSPQPATEETAAPEGPDESAPGT